MRLKTLGLPVEKESVNLLTSEVVTDQLSNGMKVFVKQVYPSSVVNLAVWVRVGSVNETDRVAGISHFIEHMLFKGTDKRAVGEIAKEIHGCGGYMNAFTDFECTCYWIVLPSKYLSVALDVQADAFLHSTFDAEELRKECQVIIEELKMYEDRPEAYSFEKLLTLAYQKHTYGRPIIGFEETLRATTRQDLVDYYHQYYQANNMFVTLVGDVEPTRAIRKIKQAFKGMPSGKMERNSPLPEPTQTELRVQELEGEIARSYFQMAFHMPSATHEDSYALRLLATLLGEGRSSRLNLTLREKEQLADQTQAGVFAQQDPGLFYVSLMLEDKNVEEAKKSTWREIERLQHEEVSPEELLKAKNMTESDYVFSQETVEGQGRNLGYHEMLGDYTLAEKFLERLSDVSSADVKRIAQKYLTRGNCSQVIYHSKGDH